MRRGMILAAGLGTRLLPITDAFPKPLVPVLNVPNVLFSLFLLREAGIREIAINLHHLPDLLRSFLGTGERWGVRITYSQETALLGTGGGVKKLEAFFAGESFVLVNCDFVSDLSLAPFLERHAARDSLATMLLLRDEGLQLRYSAVGVDTGSHLCALPRKQVSTPAASGIFTGVHLLAAETLRWLPEGPCGINDVLYPTLMASSGERVFGDFLPSGSLWCDTGETSTLWETSLTLLTRLAGGDPRLAEILAEASGVERKAPGIWAPREESLPTGVELDPPILLGRNVSWASGCRVSGAVVGDGCRLGDGASADRSVLLPASELLPGEALRGAIRFRKKTLPVTSPPGTATGS